MWRLGRRTETVATVVRGQFTPEMRLCENALRTKRCAVINVADEISTEILEYICVLCVWILCLRSSRRCIYSVFVGCVSSLSSQHCRAMQSESQCQHQPLHRKLSPILLQQWSSHIPTDIAQTYSTYVFVLMSQPMRTQPECTW